MKLSVMPVYNERATIGEAIHQVLQVPLALQKEWIVVDDGSTDGTWGYLQHLQQQMQGGTTKVTVLFYDRNLDKGAAIRTTLSQVTGEIVCIQGTDLEYDPNDYPALLRPVLEGRSDVVLGNRFHGGPHRALYFWHFVGNRVITTCRNLVAV